MRRRCGSVSCSPSGAQTGGRLDPECNPVPGITPAAKQQGQHVAATIRALLAANRQDMPFRYRYAGSLATIGKHLALIDFGRIKLRGTLAWWITGIAHIYFLIGGRNRLGGPLCWLWIHTRDQRSSRLITQESAASERKRSNDHPRDTK
jgi:NADH dehydrogenase